MNILYIMYGSKPNTDDNNNGCAIFEMCLIGDCWVENCPYEFNASIQVWLQVNYKYLFV